MTNAMGRTGGEIWSVRGVWPTTAGCEDGARGPWIKECKQLLEPENRPPLISSRKTVTSVLHLQGTEFFQLHELAEHRFSLEPPERDTMPDTFILAHGDPCCTFDEENCKVICCPKQLHLWQFVTKVIENYIQPVILLLLGFPLASPVLSRATQVKRNKNRLSTPTRIEDPS